MSIPVGGTMLDYARALGVLANQGQLTSSTVRLPSYSQVYSPDSVLGGTVGNPQVITGSGASAQSPLGSLYDTGQNIMGFTQDMRGLSLFNQGQQIGTTAQDLDPIVDKNIERTKQGMLFSQNLDPNRQKQINSALEAAAKMKAATATAQTAANQFGGLQLTRNV
tara:strand:+ start:356 stop:850 length:495 start_codon:yes stop_codon:yes gene_type:complete